MQLRMTLKPYFSFLCFLGVRIMSTGHPIHLRNMFLLFAGLGPFVITARTDGISLGDVDQGGRKEKTLN